MLTRLVGVTAWSRDGFVLLVLKMGNNGCQAPSLKHYLCVLIMKCLINIKSLISKCFGSREKLGGSELNVLSSRV